MRLVFLFVLMLCLHVANAQSVNIAGVFPTIDHSGTIRQKWEYSLYYFAALPLVNFKSPKFSRDAHYLLFYSEQALTYKINEKWSITASYVFQRERPLSKSYTNENRLFAQATYKHKIKSFQIKHRLRFDNRFIHDRTKGETPYTHRLRYLLGLKMSVNKKENLYFVAYEESFLNTFRGASKVYGENWAYAALGIKLNKVNSIETGPLYITWNTERNNWFNQYYLQLTWVSHLTY